jgi:hypothetical protein
MEREASGHVNRERQFLRGTELGDQPFESLTQVGHSSLTGITVAIRTHTGTQLRVGTPHTVFVLLPV